jgi:hypothetical protein
MWTFPEELMMYLTQKYESPFLIQQFRGGEYLQYGHCINDLVYAHQPKDDKSTYKISLPTPEYHNLCALKMKPKNPQTLLQKSLPTTHQDVPTGQQDVPTA